jgi:crossover junction endodeoxyribonuclease RuvC
MVVLGVDPGTRRTGYAVVEVRGDRVFFLRSGAVCPAPGLPFHEKLKQIYEGLREVLSEYAPDEIAIEDVFVRSNPRVALRMGHVRGVALLAGALSGIGVAEYAPREIKQAIVGNGNASKEQVKFMVTALLRLTVEISEDESDALAVAITHVHRLTEEGSPVDILHKRYSC